MLHIYISIYSYIFTYIWAIGGVNVGKYSIHGVYGFHNLFNTSWCKAMLHLRQQSPGPVLYGFGSGVCQSQCLDWKDTGVLGTTVPQSTKRYMTQVNLDIANKNRFFTQKRLVYVDNFMGTVHTEGQPRHFGYHLESWLEGNRDTPAMHAWNPNNLHLWGWTQNNIFAGHFFGSVRSLSLSVCLILSLPHSLSCFPNGSDSSIHKVADDPSRLILGKTSAAQGGVRPCFYAEIPAKAPAAGPYTIATSTSTTV